MSSQYDSDEDDSWGWFDCEHCQGAGVMYGECNSCAGTGYRADGSTCPHCKGSKEIEVRCPICQNRNNGKIWRKGK